VTETAAYRVLSETTFRATALTGGPWSPEHQHAGPPSALICRAVERAAAPHGLTHIGRLTVNLLRPLPIGSTLEGGVFYWQAGPGFLGEYQLLFERPDAPPVRVKVNIRPRASATSAQ